MICCCELPEMVFCVEDGVNDNHIEFADDAIDFEEHYSNKRQKYTYEYELSEPLTPGTVIVVKSHLPTSTSRFAIDVYSHTSPEYFIDDIILHFNPRCLHRCIIRNTYKNMVWGYEEYYGFRKFPFEYEQPFTIELLVAEKQWIVSINNEYYCEYRHRIPFSQAKRIEIVDLAAPIDLHLNTVTSFPHFDITNTIEIPHFTEFKLDSFTLKLPLHMKAVLPNGIAEGNQLILIGRIRMAPHSFILDLADGRQEWPKPDIMLHFNPRLGISSQKSRQLVIMNSKKDGVYGQEKRFETGKFIGGTVCMFRFVRNKDNWTVFYSNDKLGFILHRLDANLVTSVKLKGDLIPYQCFTCPVDIKASYTLEGFKKQQYNSRNFLE